MNSIPEPARTCTESSTTTYTSHLRPYLSAPRWRLGLAAAVVALIIGVAMIVVPGPEPTGRAYAATPHQLAYAPLDRTAPQLLEEIATHAERAPDTLGEGPYLRVSAQEWALWSRIDGETVTSAVVPQEWIAVRRRDGSGIERRTFTPPGQPTRTESSTLEPGPLMFPEPLPTESAALAARLEAGHPVANGPAERLVAIADLYREQPVRPKLRAALLRYLAQTPTLSVSGSVSDRLGRPGIAFSVTSDYSGLPTRSTLIVDPRTGTLLGSEETLTTSAGQLNVPIPSVIQYDAFRDSAFTDELSLD